MTLEEIIEKAGLVVKDLVNEYYPDDIGKIIALLPLIADKKFASDLIQSFGDESQEKWNDGTNYVESLDDADVRVKDIIRNELEQLVAVIVPVSDASDYISERFMSQRTHDLSRIIVTENTRINAEQEIKKGERYIYRCVHDGKTCQNCLDLDGKVFLSSDSDIGSNLPPIHPWCRCRVEVWTN